MNKKQEYEIELKLLVKGFPVCPENFQYNNFKIDFQKINVKNYEELIDKDEFTPYTYFYDISTIKPENYLVIFKTINNYKINLKGLSRKNVENDFLNKMSKDNVIDADLNMLKSYLMLIFGYNIVFPFRKYIIYKDGKKFADLLNLRKEHINLPQLISDEWDHFKKKNTFSFKYIDYKKFIEKSKNFKKANMFYEEALLIENSSVRFLLLFSSIESLFNLKNFSFKDKCELCEFEIKLEKIANSMGKIKGKISSISNHVPLLASLFLFEHSNIIAFSLYEKMKKFYSLRSNFIHGKVDSIELEDELIFREQVRQILILYYMYAHNQKFLDEASEEIEKNIIVKRVNSINVIQTKLLAQTFRSENYQDSYLENLIWVNKYIESGDLIKDKSSNSLLETNKNHDNLY